MKRYSHGIVRSLISPHISTGVLSRGSVMTAKDAHHVISSNLSRFVNRTSLDCDYSFSRLTRFAHVPIVR